MRQKKTIIMISSPKQKPNVTNIVKNNKIINNVQYNNNHNKKKIK